MLASILLLFKFIVDIFKRLINESYYRSLGLVILLVLLAGTLFYWLAQGRSFMQALSFSVGTMAMNSPFGIGEGTATLSEVIFHLLYQFLSVGIYLLFILETGKTMIQTYEDFNVARTAKRTNKKNKN